MAVEPARLIYGTVIAALAIAGPRAGAKLLGCATVCLISLLLAPIAAQAFGVGCGIYVREESGSSEQIFFAKHDDSIVLMLIGGELETLAVVPAESRGQLRDLGDVMQRVYTNGSTRIEATFTVTRACSPDARECDGVGIAAIFSMRTGDVTREIGGTGASGC